MELNQLLETIENLTGEKWEKDRYGHYTIYNREDRVLGQIVSGALSFHCNEQTVWGPIVDIKNITEVKRRDDNIYVYTDYLPSYIYAVGAKFPKKNIS